MSRTTHIKIRCPECRGQYRVPSKYHGTTVACPICDSPVRPGPSTTDRPSTQKNRDDVSSAGRRRRHGTNSRYFRNNRRTFSILELIDRVPDHHFLMVAGAVGLVLLAFVLTAVFGGGDRSINGNNAEEPAASIDASSGQTPKELYQTRSRYYNNRNFDAQLRMVLPSERPYFVAYRYMAIRRHVRIKSSDRGELAETFRRTVTVKHNMKDRLKHLSYRRLRGGFWRDRDDSAEQVKQDMARTLRNVDLFALNRDLMHFALKHLDFPETLDAGEEVRYADKSTDRVVLKRASQNGGQTFNEPVFLHRDDRWYLSIMESIRRNVDVPDR